MMKGWHLGLLVLLFFYPVSCRTPPPPQSSPPEETKAYGDELVTGVFHQPGVLNPLVTYQTIATSLFELLFDSLGEVVAENKIEPSLAERWEITDEGRTWIFYLRKGVLFHDGTELTAEDLKFTFESLMKIPGGVYAANLLRYVKSFSAPSRYVFRVELSRYDHHFMGNTLLMDIVPRHLLQGTDLAKAPFNDHPIGSGPFRFVSRTDREILFEANEHYFRGRPYLDRIRVRMVDFPQGYIDFVTGQLDHLLALQEGNYEFLLKIPDIKVYRKFTFPFLYFLGFNGKREVFHSPKVRRALGKLIDYRQFAALLPDEKLEPAGGPIPPWETETYEAPGEKAYDPEEGLRLLAEEGWKRPFRFTLLSDDAELSRKIVAEIQAQFSRFGISVQAQFLPLVRMVKELERRHFDAVLLFAFYHPWTFPYYGLWHSQAVKDGANCFSYSNPAVDAALDQSRLSPDERERRVGLKRLQKLLQEDSPAVFLFWRYNPVAFHKRFRGILEAYEPSSRLYRKIWVPKEEQKYE
jgi:peptide/nickel transport system substrate-binding protein